MINKRVEFLLRDGYGNPNRGRHFGTIRDHVMIGQGSITAPYTISAYLIELEKPNYQDWRFELVPPADIIRIVFAHETENSDANL